MIVRPSPAKRTIISSSSGLANLASTTARLIPSDSSARAASSAGRPSAVGEEEVRAVLQRLALPEGNGFEFGVHGDARHLAFRETDGRRLAVGEGRGEHVLQLVLVARRHEDDIGHVPQKSDIVDALMSRAVVGHDPRPVQGEHDRQVLEADVVIDLVVGALEERRIDGADGFEAAERQPGGEIHGVLLGDADVEELPGQFFREIRQARPFRAWPR